MKTTKRQAYRRFPDEVRRAIQLTGRVDLFPELKIPRTTARRWIAEGITSSALADSDDTMSVIENLSVSSQAKQNKYLEADAHLKLMKYTHEVVGTDLRLKQITSRQIRSKIIDAIEIASKLSSIQACLDVIGISLSRFKRWRSELVACGLTELRSCPKAKLNQLTLDEVRTMRRLVTSLEFAHYPLRSLHFYAKREKLLFCSYTTWHRYIKLYGWLRPRKQYRKRKYKIGIRAKQPNEIWHLDVSYFILPNKTKCFIQAVVDNYSRYVIAWQVLPSFDGSKTADLLQQALKKTARTTTKKKKRLIVDGGGENKSDHVKKLEQLGHFKKQVARFEISFSNSIVEAVFRSAKHNHLFHSAIVSYTQLQKQTDFWFTEHNERIPHSSFDGETPLERFDLRNNDERMIRIVVAQKAAVKLRIQHNQKLMCGVCSER